MSGSEGDIRRRVAHRAYGAYRVLVDLHSAHEDVVGAAESEQWLTAALQARTALLRSLSIRSLAEAGEFQMLYDDLMLDPMAGLPLADFEEAMAISVEAAESEADGSWLDALQRHLDQTEADLGYDQKLESIRTPDGLFPALRIIREWLPALEQLDLPALLPSAWTESPR